MNKTLRILFAVLLAASLGVAAATPVTAQNNTINVPGDYPTIQAAIDAASDGDTIVVAAASYPENVTVDKSLTLKGAQAGVDARTRSGDETIIEPGEGTGIRIITAAGRTVVIDGVTVRNTLHGITTPEPAMAADITVRNVRAINAGEFAISLTFTETVTVEYCYVSGADFGINAGALEPFPATEATFRHNEVVNTRIGFTGFLKNSVLEGNVARDFTQPGTGISGQFINTEIIENTVSGYTKGAGITFEGHYGRPMPRDVRVEGNTLADNSIGVYVFDTQTELDGITLNFNNIADNSWYGIWNDGGEALEATRNWWGDVSGPGRTGPGEGDDVSSKVLYSPWLGNPVGTEPMTWGVDTTGTIQEAVDTAGDGDTVVVSMGEYEESLLIDKSLTLRSLAGYEETAIIGSVSLELDGETVFFGGDETGFTIDADGNGFAIRLSASNGSEVTIRQNRLTNAVAGITSQAGFLDDSTVNVEDNRILRNEYGIYLSSIAGDSAVFANFNSLAQNDVYGLYVEVSTVTIEATYNWWGHASGPSGGVVDPDTGRVADGTGSAVSANVRFDPWITAFLHTLEISSTSGGSLYTPEEGVHTYDAGTEVELVALTDTFYRFAGWTGDVDTVANVRSAATTVTMDADYVITANFNHLFSCFIATAAYGSETAEELDVLREFRDTILLSNLPGTGLVTFYYKTSPPMAELISRHDGLRALVRVSFIDPIVKTLDRTRGLWSESPS